MFKLIYALIIAAGEAKYKTVTNQFFADLESIKLNSYGHPVVISIWSYEQTSIGMAAHFRRKHHNGRINIKMIFKCLN